MIRKTIPSQINQLGDDEVEVILSTGTLARDGHILDPAGAKLDNFRKNPVILFSHDPTMPVGRASDINVVGDKIVARITFAPAGISTKADEIRGLVKASVISGISIGFEPIDSTPLDPKRPRGGQNISSWELLEGSFVAVNADTGAVVTARDLQRADSEQWKVGASRDLPIEDGDPAWDGSAAQASIFEWAGGNEFDPAKVRRGFLAYDASAPDKRGSYKLPFVHVVDDKLEVPKSALRAASGAHGVQAAQIGDAKDEAQAVLSHYKEKAGIGEEGSDAEGRAATQGDEGERAKEAARRAIRTKAAMKRGLLAVADLAYVLYLLNDAKQMAKWEAEIEGDDSALPAMLGACVKELGAAFLAMSEEEVAELFDGDDTANQVEIMLMEKSPTLHRLLAFRAGKAVSAANAGKLAEADGQCDRALGHCADAEEARGLMEERCRGLEAAHGKAADAHDKMGAALDEGDLDEAKKQHTRMKRNLDAIADHNTGLGDDHRTMGRSIEAISDRVRSAQRACRAVAEPGIDDHNPDDDEAGDDDTAEGERSLAARQAAKRALVAVAA